MTYKLDFLEEALAEWNKLNPSIKQPLKKKLIKVLENPRIPKNKLSGHPNRYKIKLRSIGYRLVYEVVDDEVVVIVIAVGRRENNAVYDDANSRALLQITTNGKLKTVLAKGAAYESFPWSAFSGRNHSLGCALVL